MELETWPFFSGYISIHHIRCIQVLRKNGDGERVGCCHLTLDMQQPSFANRFENESWAVRAGNVNLLRNAWKCARWRHCLHIVRPIDRKEEVEEWEQIIMRSGFSRKIPAVVSRLRFTRKGHFLSFWPKKYGFFVNVSNGARMYGLTSMSTSHVILFNEWVACTIQEIEN